MTFELRIFILRVLNPKRKQKKKTEKKKGEFRLKKRTSSQKTITGKKIVQTSRNVKHISIRLCQCTSISSFTYCFIPSCRIHYTYKHLVKTMLVVPDLATSVCKQNTVFLLINPNLQARNMILDDVKQLFLRINLILIFKSWTFFVKILDSRVAFRKALLLKHFKWSFWVIKMNCGN